MQKLACEYFVKHSQALRDALSSEDYEDTGIIDLSQCREAIASVLEDIDDHLMDWMLYYIYARSEHVDRMEYKVLISMIEEAQKKERLSSAKQRRPESSNLEKIKERNNLAPPALVKQDPIKPVSDEDEKYSSDDNDLNDVRNLLPQKESEYEESPRPKADQLSKDLNESDRLDARSRSDDDEAA